MDRFTEDLRVALDFPADKLWSIAMLLGKLADRLPHDVLTPEERPIYARMRYMGQDEFVHQTGLALRRTRFVPAEGTTTADLEELANRNEQYLGLVHLGDRIRTVGQDMRLLYGTFQWYLIDKVLSYLERRFADPKLTSAENESLLKDFGAMLIELDEMLRKGPEHKDELFKRRLVAQAVADDAQAEAEMAETIYQLHSGQTPERAALVAAAKRYFAQHPEALKASEQQVDPNRPKTGPRKVIR